jgi:ABC-type glycerol-3-phosphate transport system substrate-binding protein
VVWENLPPAQAKALAEDAAAFQKESPSYTVTLRHYDNPEAFMTPLQAGEIQFDVALVSPVLLSSLWTANLLTPVSDFFAPSFLDNFAAITLQGARRDGKMWGLADTAGFHLLLYYNRDWVDIPPLDTKQLAQLTQSGVGQGRAPAQVLGLNSYDPLWLIPWLSPYDGWLTDSRGRPSLNTPAMQKALTLYLGWQDQTKGLTSLATYDELRAQFVAGTLPMVIDGDWAIGELARAANLDWGVAPLPGVVLDEGTQPAAPLVLARYWVISQTTRGNKALAAASWAEFVTRPKRQLDRTVRFGLLPTRREALDDPIIVNDSALRISSEQMLAGRAIALGVNPDALLNAMREPLRQALAGEVTPAEAAQMMQTNAQ